MPKQLILLAGLHKTATTSIQRTCAGNLKLLHDAGFSYPFAQFQGQWESNHTRLLNRLFRREPHKTGLLSQFVDATPREPGSLEADRANFERAIADAARLIVAAEGVSLFSPDELRGMKEWFDQRDWQVRVLCHVRHLSSWISSIVGQRVTGPVRMPIALVVDEFIRHGSVVRRRIENLRQVFPETEFFSHELAVQHAQGPVGFFFQAIGFALPTDLKFVRANEGRSDCATRVLSIINEKFGPFDAQAQPNARVFGGEGLTQLLTTVGGQKFKLRQDEAHPLMALLQAENQWLGETLGEEFRDPRLEFKSAQWRWNPETVQELRPVVAAMPRPVRAWVLSQLPLIGLQLGVR